MKTWILLCLCVAYVAGQVIVPRLSPENQKATEDHLAAVARATQTHFEAHKNIAPESQGYAPQQNALPYAPQGHLGGYSSGQYNPYGGFGQNFPFQG